MSRTVSLLIRVRYGECDAQQVVFNARYADYIDLAATEFIRVLFGGYQNIIDDGMDTQVVNMNINWQAPARFDDVLQIDIVTGRIGNSSYRLDVTFRQYESLQKIADGEITYVMVDTKGYQKMAIPESFKQKLQQSGPRLTIDQAGTEVRSENHS